MSVEGFFYFKTFVIWLLLVRASLCNVRLLKNFISFRSVDREIPSSQLHRKLLLIIPLYTYATVCSAQSAFVNVRVDLLLSLSPIEDIFGTRGFTVYYCI